jgi:hypothetical protein
VPTLLKKSSEDLWSKDKKGSTEIIDERKQLICPVRGFLFVEKKKAGLFAPSGATC